MMFTLTALLVAYGAYIAYTEAKAAAQEAAA